MSEPSPRQRLIGILAPAGRARLCRMAELLEDDSPLALLRVGLLAAGLFVPAPGEVGQFVQILVHFGIQALPARVGPPARGDIYVLKEGGQIGFVTNLWLDARQPAAPPASFDGLSTAGERRIACEEVDFWLRLPGAG